MRKYFFLFFLLCNDNPFRLNTVLEDTKIVAPYLISEDEFDKLVIEALDRDKLKKSKRKKKKK